VLELAKQRHPADVIRFPARMKVLLDECVDVENCARTSVTRCVFTVSYMKWKGLRNGAHTGQAVANGFSRSRSQPTASVPYQQHVAAHADRGCRPARGVERLWTILKPHRPRPAGDCSITFSRGTVADVRSRRSNCSGRLPQAT
jgi:hypothetical protein